MVVWIGGAHDLKSFCVFKNFLERFIFYDQVAAVNKGDRMRF